MKILLVDNHDSFTYNLVQLLEQAVCCDITVVKNNVSKYDCSTFDKFIFSPGPGVPKEEAGLMRFILSNYSENKSILGICLGHQAIGEFYGASLISIKKPFHGIKEKINILDVEDYLFKNMPKQTNGGLYHSWCVDQNEFSDDLQITAISESGIIMGISHKTLDVKGLQFHPESIMTDYGKVIIRNWLEK